MAILDNIKRDWKVEAIALALWVTAALSILSLNRWADTVTLIWAPAGIAFCALWIIRVPRWTGFLTMIFFASAAIHLAVGLNLTIAIGSSIAQVAGPFVATTIARKAITARRLHYVRLNELLKLTSAAGAGAVVSAVLSWPFRSSHQLIDFTWWVFAFLLGIMVFVPVAIYLRRRMVGSLRVLSSRPIEARQLVEGGICLLGAALLSWGTLHAQNPILFMLFVATIFSVMRFGQTGASLVVVALGLAGHVTSAGGKTPIPFYEGDPMFVAFLLQLFMAILLAASLPLAALLMSHKRLSERVSARNQRLHRNNTMLNLAENMAGVGRWRRDHVAGVSEWSPELLRMNGITHEQSLDPQYRRQLLVDGGRSFDAGLEDNRENTGTFTFEFDIKRPDGTVRTLRMQAQNVFDEAKTPLETFGVVIDITGQRLREKALKNARADAMRSAAEAQLLAQTDSLTKLANRRRTITQLERMVHAANTTEAAPLGVITFDIDHFKSVNDTYGHQAGDEVLIKVAEIARAQARANDLVGRLGGEEFVWLLPMASDTIAAQAAERLRQAVAEESGVGDVPAVTISVGWAILRVGDTTDSILARADEALYAAKENGRNQVRKAA